MDLHRHSTPWALLAFSLFLVGCGGNVSSTPNSSQESSSSQTSVGEQSSSPISSSSSETESEASSSGIAYTQATIADLLKLTSSVTDKAYEVTGILERRGPNDMYGTSYLTDAATGKTIYIYNLTGTAKALTYASGSFTYTAPNDAATSLLGVNNGEKVILHAVYVYYNGVPELKAVLAAHTTSNATYSITGETDGNGTVSFSPNSGLYDTAVTLTLSPNEGYETYVVSLQNAQGGSSVVNANTNGSYVVYLTCVNHVVVSFTKSGQSFSSVASYDFSALPYEAGTNYGALDDVSLLAAFQNSTYLVSGSSVVTDAHAVKNMMLADSQQGPKKLGIKFGKKGAGGDITLKLSKAVQDVKITFVTWPNDATTVSVNGGSALTGVDSNSTVMDFKLDEGTADIEVVTSLRGIMTGIEFLEVVK